MIWGGGSRRRDSGDGGGGSGVLGIVFFVIWLVAIALAPFVAQMLAMMVSRQREFLADASGAELTRNPIGLAHALEKIEGAAAPTAAIKRGIGASLHRRSARAPHEHQGRLLVGPVRLASANGRANRGVEGDGIRGPLSGIRLQGVAIGGVRLPWSLP